MLDNDAKRNIETMKQLAEKMWGDNCELGELVVSGGEIFAMFYLYFRLYQKVDALIYYERSGVGFGVKQGEDYVSLKYLAPSQLFDGYKSMEIENIGLVFQALDKFARKMASKAE